MSWVGVDVSEEVWLLLAVSVAVFEGVIVDVLLVVGEAEAVLVDEAVLVADWLGVPDGVADGVPVALCVIVTLLVALPEAVGVEVLDEVSAWHSMHHHTNQGTTKHKLSTPTTTASKM